MPIRFASEAWPRPGLAELRSASIAGFVNTEPLSSREEKGKDGHDQDKTLVLSSFLVPEIDMIFGDGVGGLPCNLIFGDKKSNLIFGSKHILLRLQRGKVHPFFVKGM